MGPRFEISRMPVAQRPPQPKDYNPYEGREVTGVTETVLSRGRVIVENGKFVGRAGAGSFLKRKPR
jgi:N-acyl-D-aspartate/D-glutamate deacylase